MNERDVNPMKAVFCKWPFANRFVFQKLFGILVALFAFSLTGLQNSSAGQQPSEIVPVISIVSNSGDYVFEGDQVEFRLKSQSVAVFQPDLAVNVRLENVRGNYLADEEMIQLNVRRFPKTFSVATVEDVLPLADGLIRATLVRGTGYDVISPVYNDENPHQALVRVYNNDWEATELSLSTNHEKVKPGQRTPLFINTNSPTYVTALLKKTIRYSNGDVQVNEFPQLVRGKKANSQNPATSYLYFDDSIESIMVELLPGEGLDGTDNANNNRYAIADGSGSVVVSVDASIADPLPIMSVYPFQDNLFEGEYAMFDVYSSLETTSDLEVNIGVELGGMQGFQLTDRITYGKGRYFHPVYGIIKNDAVLGESGTIKVVLKAGDGYIVSQTAGSATISVEQRNSIPIVSVTSNESAVTEGEILNFRIATDGSESEDDLTVNIRVETTGGDFIRSMPDSTVDLPSGMGETLLSIPTVDDEEDEADGSVTVSVSDGSGYIVDVKPRNRATVAVLDDEDDIVPMIEIAGTGTFSENCFQTYANCYDVLEGEKIRISLATDTGLSADTEVKLGIREVSRTNFLGWSVSGGVEEDKFGVQNYRFVTVKQRNTDAAIELQTYHDNSVDGVGHVSVRLLSGAGYSIGSGDAAQVINFKVKHNPAPDLPVITIESDSADGITEGEDAVFRITSSRLLADALEVNFGVAENGDFIEQTGHAANQESHSGSAFIGMGESSTQVRFRTSDDSTHEMDGRIVVSIIEGEWYEVSGTSESVIIVEDNDDPVVSISRIHPDDNRDYDDLKVFNEFFHEPYFDEGDGIVIELRTDQAPVASLEVGLKIKVFGSSVHMLDVPELGMAADQDDPRYLSGVATVRFESGQQTAAYVLQTDDDSVYEGGEGVFVEIIQSEGYRLYNRRARVGYSPWAHFSILDNDSPIISVSSGGTVVDGDTVRFTIASDRALLSGKLINIKVSATSNVAIYDLPSPYYRSSSPQVVPRSTPYNVAVRLPNGSTTVDFVIPKVEIADFEESAHVFVTVLPDTTIAPYRLGNTRASVEVRPREIEPEISISADSVAITEGEYAEFALTADIAPRQNLNVNIVVEDTGDFLIESAPPAVEIPAGKTDWDFEISTYDDENDEADGTISVGLLAGTGYTYGNPSATVDVLDNDAPEISISAAAASVVEEDRGSTTVGFHIHADIQPREPLILRYAIGVDSKTEHTTVLNFTIDGSGNGYHSLLSVRLLDDFQSEDGELRLALIEDPGSPASYKLADSPNDRATVTLLKNDPKDFEVSISAQSETVSEGDSVQFRLSASPAASSKTDVNISLTSVHNLDEQTSSHIVTIFAGESSKVFSVATPDDDLHGTTGSVTAAILEDSGYEVGNTGSASVTVVENDARPLVSVSSVTDSIVEGEQVWFLISANRASVDQKSVNLTVSESGGSFFDSHVPESVELWAGYRVVYLRVQTVDDDIDDVDGNVIVTLDSGTGYSVNTAAASASVDVVDDDVALPVASVVSMNGPSISEGTSANFTISTDVNTTENTDIIIHTAVVGDYISGEVSRIVRIEANSNSVFLSIPTADDETDEPDGSILLEILEGEGYTVASSPDNIASVAVTDNDLPPANPTLSITNGSVTVQEGGIAEISISAAAAIGSDLTISVQIEENGESSRRTLYMDAGDLTVILPITTIDDEVFKGETLVRVTLLPGIGYQVGPANRTALVTVLENEIEPEISVEAISSITEGSPVWFLFKSSRATVTGLTVGISIEELVGSYLLYEAPNSVEIEPYHRHAVIGLETSDDNVPEGDGSVNLTIWDGEGYAVASKGGEVSVRVFDNDHAGSVPTVSTSSVMDSMEEGGIAIFRVHASSIPLNDFMVNLRVVEAGEFISGETLTEVEIFRYNTVGLVLVRTEDDDIAETDGSVTLEILEGNGYAVASGPGASTTVEVSDNDEPSKVPDISIFSTSTSVAEGNDAEFVLQSLRTLDADISIRMNVDVIGNFFDQVTDEIREIELKAGTESKQFSIPTIGDDLEESDGSITITIVSDDSSPATYNVSETNFTASVNITDDDDRALISIESVASPLEESAGFAEFAITSSKVLPYDLTISVDVRETGDVISGTAPEMVRLIADQSWVVLQVPLSDDSDVEEGSRITATLVQGASYAITPSNNAYVDVEDNDADSTRGRELPVVAITSDSSEILEGDRVEFTVSLDSVAYSELAVGIEWTSEGDFLFASSGIATATLNFGESLGLFSLDTTDDSEIESDGSITATLRPGEGYVLISDEALRSFTISILDNDSSPNPGRSEALHRSVLPNLLGATSDQTANAVSSRIDLAFDNAGQDRFELAGANTVEEIVKLTGKLMNEADVELTSVLSGSSFALPIIPNEDGGSAAILWGNGFSRDFLVDGNESSVDWNGELFSGLLGFDTRFGSGLLAGMAASSNESSLDFRYEDREGVLEGVYKVGMTSLQPYFGWSNHDLSTRLRASAGFGLGEVEIDYGNYDSEVAESRQYSMLLGGTDRLYSSDSLFGGASELTFNAEVRTARQFVEGNGGAIVGASVDARRLRINAEGTFEKQLESGSVFKPTLLFGTRWDGGDERQGLGFEIAGGVDFRNPLGLSVAGSGRMLMLDDSTSNDRGLKGELNYEQGSDGIGLFTSFSPAWGKFNSKGINKSDLLGNSDGLRLESEVGYGIGILDGRLVLSPFATTELNESGRNRYGIGSRLANGSGMNFELEGFYDSASVGTAYHKVQLEFGLEW